MKLTLKAKGIKGKGNKGQKGKRAKKRGGGVKGAKKTKSNTILIIPKHGDAGKTIESRL
eukprot:Pgem_evm1s11441